MLGEYAKRPTDPGHPIGFSDVDRSAIASLAATIGPILEGPFGAAVVHTESCAAVVVEEGGLAPIERIASVGRSLRILSPARSVLRRRTTDVPGLDDRQRDALGTVLAWTRDEAELISQLHSQSASEGT
jgi:hypothetical protein